MKQHQTKKHEHETDNEKHKSQNNSKQKTQEIKTKKNLKLFTAPILNKKSLKVSPINKIINLLKKSKKPLIIAGQGIRQSKTINDFKKLVNRLKLPVLFSRLGQDILPHNHPYIFGQAGVKGSRYCKKIMKYWIFIS
mgnify:CR=1 FL=1